MVRPSVGNILQGWRVDEKVSIVETWILYCVHRDKNHWNYFA